jgi:guanylate kinase
MTLPFVPVVLVAPSGTGKTSLANSLVTKLDRYVFSVSATTRAPRPGEEAGVDYHFLSREEFERRVEAGEFSEWADVHGELYGTPRDEIESAADRGQHVVLDIDVQGARQIRESIPEATLIFVLPPSVGIMLARLEGRGTESPEEIDRRLRSAIIELEAVPEFDHVVVNDDFDSCVEDIRRIVERRGSPRPADRENAPRFRREIAELLDERASG